MTLLDRSNTDWDIIALSECWLPHTSFIPAINGYHYVKTEKNLSQNEGVVVYFKNHMHLSISEPNIQDANCLTLEIDNNTLVIALYRPSRYKNADPFLQSLNDFLTGINYHNIIVVGDINIDILPGTNDPHSLTYLNLLAYQTILPAHTIVTHGKTCLDHFMLKSKRPAHCYVAKTSITDHDSIILILEEHTRSPFKSTIVKKIDYVGLDNAMKNLNVHSIYKTSDTNAAMSIFVGELNNIINSNTKVIKISNRQKIKKPWITKGLLKCMKNRDKLHQKSSKNPDDEIIKITYKRYRNFCNSLLKKIKREYEKNTLQKAATTNNKVLWDTIKDITHSKRIHSSASDLISKLNPTSAVNDVNDYFASIGRNLAEKILKDTDNKKSTLPPCPYSFVLNPTDEEEVSSCILNLKKLHSTGRDSISAGFLVRYIHILASPLTYLINLMFSTGIFPSELKLAEVIPIHKGGARDCVNNYRPISMLPTLSKVAEKLINKRLVNYLDSKTLLSKSQFGFRAGVSTSDAVHELVDHIVTKLDNGKKVIGIFLDLAKAFDTVSAPLLMDKLEKLGIRGIQHNLFQDYLSNRQQRVKIDENVSEDLPITYGVPQGSVLGPTLFLTYINDLCNLQLPNGKVITYADDTALIFHGDTWEQAYDFAQSGFNTVTSWLTDNVLTLNVDKTKFIPFSIRRSAVSVHNKYSIKAHFCKSNQVCQCDDLTLAFNIKYLGVMIDSTLSFNRHIDLLSSRTRKLIFIFKTLRHVSDKNIINMVYLALCQSILCYCITVWGGSCKSRIIKLERAQRAVLKVSHSLPFFFPTKDLYSLSNVLSIRKLFVLNTILKQHSSLKYDPSIMQNRRVKHMICRSNTVMNTVFSNRFFEFLGGYLYNKANKMLQIYSLTKANVKKVVSEWLRSLDYEETENLLHIVS